MIHVSRTIYITFLLAIVLMGCNAKNHYKILSFFFDGVPPPEAPKTMEAAPRDSKVTADKPEAPLREIFTHKPFGANQCTLCHDLSQGNRVDTSSALCFRCHGDEKAKGKMVHMPVALGDCLTCHDPHQSGFKYQLRSSPPMLCFNCHDQALMEGRVKHAAVELAGCPFCHSPHSSRENKLLQMAIPDLCIACHGADHSHIKDMLEAKLVCTQCHSPHSTKEAKLLK